MCPSVHAETNCYLINECTNHRRDSSSGPSPGTQVKINPSAVPTDKGYGVEAIYYDSSADLSLIRGNGRMGAALSPSNSEQTFFGAPGFELPEDLYERKYDKEKYQSQKVTLAAAMDIAEKKGSGLRRYSLKAGAMAKYNKDTTTITPGAGLQAVWGPLTAGYSMYDDESRLNYGDGSQKTIKYRVQTYNVGVYLSSVILNYSHLHLENNEKNYLATVHLYTASLSLGKFIFTASQRVEDSPAPDYNYELKDLENKKIKYEHFGGIQYSLSKNFLLGVLYNYYLLREISVSGTLFF
ncbi:MAG: hypothetical protein HUU57_15625 [Bdellovibrio sp.]|nr:hypothetical protein [Bdellovibrio sp.]